MNSYKSVNIEEIQKGHILNLYVGLFASLKNGKAFLFIDYDLIATHWNIPDRVWFCTGARAPAAVGEGGVR